MERLEKYDIGPAGEPVRASDGRFVRAEQAVQALNWAATLLAATGRRPAANELCEAAQQLERLDHFRLRGRGVFVPNPGGRFVWAEDVAKALYPAVEQLNRAGYWAAAGALWQLVGLLEMEGE